MTTGDLKNNLRKLHSELKLVNYCGDLDIEGLGLGKPSAFLPILHYVLVDFSLELAQYFYCRDYELLGKSDMKFLHVVYRILRDEFDLKATLTKDQFFTLGFAERKLQLVTSIVHVCRKKSEELRPRRRKTFTGLSTGKALKNKAFHENCSDNSQTQRLSKTITMNIQKNNHQSLIPDCDHVLKSHPEIQNTHQFSNNVIQEINSKMSSDSVPRKMPILCTIPESIPRRPAVTDGHTHPAVLSKENIPVNNHSIVAHISIDEKLRNFKNVEGHGSMSSTSSYIQHKERAFFVDEGKPIHPKDTSHNQTNEAEENVSLSENDIATCLGKLTTRQDSLVILKHFGEQQNRIEELERSAAQSTQYIQELTKRNSDLSARVMVLETAITLLQEKIS